MLRAGGKMNFTDFEEGRKEILSWHSSLKQNLPTALSFGLPAVIGRYSAQSSWAATQVQLNLTTNVNMHRCTTDAGGGGGAFKTTSLESLGGQR